MSRFEAAVTTYLRNAEAVLGNLRRLIAAVEGEIEAVRTDPEIAEEVRGAVIGRIGRDAEVLVRRFRQEFAEQMGGVTEQIDAWRKARDVPEQARSRARSLLDTHGPAGVIDRAEHLGDPDLLRALGRELPWHKVGDQYVGDQPGVMEAVDRAVLATDPNPEEKAVLGAALRLPGLQEQMERQSVVALKAVQGKPTAHARMAAGYAQNAAEREAAQA